MRTCSIQACLSRLLFRFSLNRFTTFCALTLGHFSAYNRPSLSFLFLPFLQVIQRPETSSGFSSPVSSITPSNFTNFRPQTSKGPFAKGRYDICFACARPVIGEPIAPTYTSLPDQPTNSSKVCQVKTVVLLGSSNFIAEHKAVKETLEGISDDGPVFEECFEFENSANSIQSVKGRLRAHFSFWLHTLGANDFILRVIDKGYIIPFITVPQNAFFDNNHSALIHVDFVSEAIQKLILSGSVVQVSSPPQVVNPLSVSIQSRSKKRILDLRRACQ